MTEIKKVSLEKVWELRRLVMYPQETIDFVKLEDDAQGFHWGLFTGGELVSVISVFPRGEEVQFRKFATLTAQQGRGFGTMLLDHVFEWAIANKKKKIWCTARLSATAIYKKIGMQQVGVRWVKYGLDFIKMEKRLD